jgi:hypothetical protein
MACAIVTKRNYRLVQALRKPSVAFDRRNQCVTKIFNENVASHAGGADHLDLEINVLPQSTVENRQHTAIRG